MGGLAGRAVPLGTTAAPTSRQKFGKVSLLARQGQIDSIMLELYPMCEDIR